MAAKERDRRAKVSQQTLEILERGFYAAPDGTVHTVSADQRRAVDGSQHYRPGELDDLLARIKLRIQSSSHRDTRFEVTRETTLAAARRLNSLGFEDSLCLNFASARNPGGGFLKGSSGQEESLARSTGLYPCIAQMQSMYQHNRSNRSLLYSDHMIYSPRVPVIRDDEGSLVAPFVTSFVTAPAVNAGAVRAKQRRDRSKIAEVMRTRIAKVLTLAVHHNHRAIVLGAWGCGVFQNDPTQIADYFFEHLLALPGLFTTAFDRVTFAIVDRSKRGEMIEPFRKAFRGGLPPRDGDG